MTNFVDHNNCVWHVSSNGDGGCMITFNNDKYCGILLDADDVTKLITSLKQCYDDRWVENLNKELEAE